jgi:hypothetical protein
MPALRRTDQARMAKFPEGASIPTGRSGSRAYWAHRPPQRDNPRECPGVGCGAMVRPSEAATPAGHCETCAAGFVHWKHPKARGKPRAAPAPGQTCFEPSCDRPVKRPGSRCPPHAAAKRKRDRRLPPATVARSIQEMCERQAEQNPDEPGSAIGGSLPG